MSEQPLKSSRHDEICKFLSEQRYASVSRLSSLLQVSAATVRRDLGEMEETGQIQRVRGGASLKVNDAVSEPSVFRRTREWAPEKRLIGEAASRLIPGGSTVFIGSGSTAHCVARELAGRDESFTVITNALTVVDALIDNPNVELMLAGGMLRNAERSMIGHIATEALRELSADISIIGVQGVDPVRGLTNDYLPEAMTDRAIVQSAHRLVVVADGRKFSRVRAVRIGEIRDATDLVTDDSAPQHVVEQVRALGPTVTVVNHGE
ncbi:DeoR/GlpR family DNA-binding transcription regulator [soil metagenome]